MLVNLFNGNCLEALLTNFSSIGTMLLMLRELRTWDRHGAENTLGHFFSAGCFMQLDLFLIHLSFTEGAS